MITILTNKSGVMFECGCTVYKDGRKKPCDKHMPTNLKDIEVH